MNLMKSIVGREPKPHHAIFVTFTRLLLCAYEAKERACRTPTVGAQADAAVAAIMAVASFEAFLNELAEFALVAEKSDWTRQTAFVAKLKDYASNHAQITREQKREQSKAKYQAAASILAGITPDWGERKNQELALLIRVRDDLIHVKPADEFSKLQDGAMSIEAPSRVQELQRRGLARKREEMPHAGWFELVMTPDFGAWAPSVVRSAISRVLDAFPQDESSPDIVCFFGSSLRSFSTLLKVNRLSE